MDFKAGDRVLIPFHSPTILDPHPAPVEALLLEYYPDSRRFDGATTYVVGPRWAAKVQAPGTRIDQWLVEVDTMCIRPMDSTEAPQCPPGFLLIQPPA